MATKGNTRETNLSTALAAKVNHVNLCPFIETVQNGTITMMQYAQLPWRLDTLYAKTSSGTCVLSVEIEGVAVTGMTSVAVSSTETSAAASANNTVAVGETVTIVVSSDVDGVDLAISLVGELT